MGLVDYKRKLFFMRVMTALISSAKDKDFIYSSMLPTVNTMCFYNLRNWLELRTCLLDLGRRFTARINLYSSYFMAIYSVFGALLMLVFFGFIHVRLTTRFWTIALFELGIVCLVLLKMLDLAAQVNQQGMEHKSMLLW